MAQNETIVATLAAQPVPEDRECIKNLTDVLTGVVDFITLDVLASASAGSGFPTTNTTAQEALTKAGEALEAANTALGSIKEKRTSGGRVALPDGDGTQSISWDPPMPSTNYEVRISMWGGGSPIGSSNQPGFWVVTGSETRSSVSINFGNVIAGMSFTWVVEDLS